MSSFRHIQPQPDSEDIITLNKNGDIISVNRRRYRRFRNISQDHIYHLMEWLKPCHHVRFRNILWVEIRNHPCA